MILSTLPQQKRPIATVTQHTLLWPEKKWWMTVLTRIWLVCNSPHNYVTSKPYIKILTHYGSQMAELERKGEHKWMHFLLHFVHPHTISVKPPLIYTANLWGKVHSQFRNNAIVAVLWGLALRKLRNKNRVRSWKKKNWPVIQPCTFTTVSAIVQ